MRILSANGISGDSDIDVLTGSRMREAGSTSLQHTGTIDILLKCDANRATLQACLLLNDAGNLGVTSGSSKRQVGAASSDGKASERPPSIASSWHPGRRENLH